MKLESGFMFSDAEPGESGLKVVLEPPDEEHEVLVVELQPHTNCSS